ncbi:MAG: hypothetical protein IKZ61_09455 [Prevotella sp.]|nr:hypothetical protein [Prevotella sp.]
MDELTNEREQSQACLSNAEREGRRRSQLNLETLERIPIPDGLEERLSAKIDEWEAHPQPLPKGRGARILRYAAVAACIALVFGVGYHYLKHEEPVVLAEQDTYQDPVLAQQEAERALSLLAANLNKGMGHLEKAKALSDKAENTLNKQLNALK